MTDETRAWVCPRKGCGQENSPETRKCAGCGVLICGARNRSGGVCRQTTGLGAGGRCRNHGGKSLSGSANPAYRHGRYVDVLPLRLRDRYERALADPDLLSMQPELAALDARISELLGRVETGESGVGWRTLRGLVDAALEARGEHDIAAVDAALQEMLALLEGRDDAKAWDDVTRAWNQRMRIVESERRRLLDAQMYVSVGHIAQVFSVLAESLRRHVRDPQERQGVVDTMQRLLGKSRPLPIGEAV